MKRLILLLFLCLLWPATSAAKDIHVLDVTGAIGPATVSYVANGLEQAKEDKAIAVILRMNTPGGLLTSTRAITEKILASDVPVIGYVWPKGAHAASAGTFILYACDIAVMAPGTNIGAATPVQMGDDTPAKELSDSDKKSLHDSIAYIRSLADARKRNSAWAEQAVRNAATLTAQDAVREKVVDYIADDIDSLLSKVHGHAIKKDSSSSYKLDTRNSTVTEKPADWRVALLQIITDPNIAFLLMTLGFYGLLYEFAHPGTFFPGVTGIIMLLLGLFAVSALPVTAAGLILFFLGLAMMSAEAFVFAKGILGIGGAIAFIFGALILFDSEDPAFRLSWVTIISTAVFIGGGLTALLTYTIKHYRQHDPNAFDAMGKECKIVDWNHDQQRVEFEGTLWMARSQSGHTYLAEEEVQIIGRDNLTLILP